MRPSHSAALIAIATAVAALGTGALPAKAESRPADDPFLKAFEKNGVKKKSATRES